MPLIKCSGVHLLDDLSGRTVKAVAGQVRGLKRKGDILVVSIHWGGNWGYPVPDEQRPFAHGLIDGARVDVVYGHSSHHVKGIEIYRGRLILYGCGDFFNDYEGIGGYEAFRGDLSLMYFPTLEPANGRLAALRMTPTRPAIDVGGRYSEPSHQMAFRNSSVSLLIFNEGRVCAMISVRPRFPFLYACI